MKKRMFPLGILLFGSVLGALAGLYLGQRGSGTLFDSSSADLSERSAGNSSRTKSFARATTASGNGSDKAREG
jgi:hypothetical protein